MATTFESIFAVPPEVIVQAPGRVELLGNHLDYNGGMVMGFAINQVVTISASLRNDENIILASSQEAESVEISLAELGQVSPNGNWENYLLGVCLEMQGDGMVMQRGFNIFVESDVPDGAGLGSSAALEVAGACALGKLYNHPLEALAMAKICQAAENKYVGMPCGMLDQTVSACSQEHHITLINCQTQSAETLEIGQRPFFWIFNTLQKHRLLDSLYSKRNQECYEIYQSLCQSIGSKPYLVDFELTEIEAIRPYVSAAGYKRAFHVYNEQKRVQQAIPLISKGALPELGILLNASHASSREFFENSCDALDFLVDHLNDHSEVYGARLTGGGFGGACIAMTSESFTEADAQQIAQQFELEFGSTPQIIPTQLSAGPLIHHCNS